MSLARAFTKRLTRSESKRPKISAPSLITSTNAASYNAPNVSSVCQTAFRSQEGILRSSSSSSEVEKSEARSEGPTPTLTDGSSVDSSPAQSPILEHNHLSCYFPSPTKVPTIESKPKHVAPNVPHRAPSHSKREHERLSRARSFRSSIGVTSADSTLNPSTSAMSPRISSECISTGTTRTDADFKAIHPFSVELEKLNEVVEDFEKGSRAVEKHMDEAVIERLELAVFSAEDYLLEIASLSAQRFDNSENTGGDQWDSWI